jgi:hypothetical protein
MSDAVGDNASLTASGASQDEHRPLGSFDSFTLLRIELREKRQCGSGSGPDDLILQGIAIAMEPGFFLLIFNWTPRSHTPAKLQPRSGGI